MPKRHYRCNFCGRDFEDGQGLRGHVEKRHSKRDVNWWVAAEDPSNLPFEVDD